MRYLVGMFGIDDSFSQAYTEKLKLLQESGQVKNDFETVLNGHTVKLWLPNDVRIQYKLLLLAESFMLKDFLYDDNKIIDLRFKIFDEACKHMLIDADPAKKHSDLGMGVDVIDTVTALFLTELLLPLYHWNSTRVKSLLTQNLNTTINK